MEDPYTGYSELLVKGIEKMKKALNSKKYKELQDQLKQAMDQVAAEKGTPAAELDANKYFPLFKECFETKITKVLETGLYHFQKLISHGYINGKENEVEPMVRTICSCVHERDDNVQLQVIKALLTMVTSLTFEVHDRALLEAFRACYHIHITSKNLVNQTTAKGALTQMLSVVFQRMEANTVAEDPQAYYRFAESFLNEEELSESALYKAVSAQVKNIVDDVCLYYAKLEQFPDEVNLIPLRSVPYILNPDDPYYRKLRVVYIHNEAGVLSGKFG